MNDIIEFTDFDPISNADRTYVLIDRGNGEFTSMFKSTWDEQQAQKELGGTL